ncbi:F-box/kelch-repeat protein At3g06240-like [Cornus florida]|uniref:F-box/kelch-repeat protein At3g06240-like n=1 Tax=Cornus florida TaxID=4283 RepID=UPI00289AE87E|nr:F-box/kelch-repeat protein At3g06240-like [Cornus florida]
MRKRGHYQSIEAPLSNNIPDDLMVDVLARLPVASLLRFRCVSKRWCALIDSPNFLNMQLNQSLTTNTNHSLIFEYDASPDHDLGSAGLDSLDDIWKHDDNIVPPVKLEYRVEERFHIIGSCNGLICLMRDDDWYNCGTSPILFNPSTKKHQILPSTLQPFADIFSQVFGFGYDPVNDDYKIVWVAYVYDDSDLSADAPLNSCGAVFTLRSNKWRWIHIQDGFPHLFNFSGVVFNGALHWVATRRPKSNVDNFIFAFDLVAENFREVKLPSTSGYRSVTLGVSGGCLWAGYIDYDYLVELWVMKSWTNLSFAIPRNRVKPLDFSNKDNLLSKIDHFLLVSNVEKKKNTHRYLGIPCDSQLGSLRCYDQDNDGETFMLVVKDAEIFLESIVSP